MNEACTCCGRTLHPDRIVMLELDQRTFQCQSLERRDRLAPQS